VLRPYWQAPVKPATSAPLDPQAEAFVTDGERAMSEGRLDDAKTALDKASVLAPKDGRVLLDLARLETVRADLVWLDLRLNEGALPEEKSAKQRQLEDLGGKAIHAADAAVGAAPDDLGAIRVKVDALRVVSNLREARDLAPKIKTIEAQPETAYVLAALDLAEPGPQWKVVIERLRSAAVGEGNLGRAQALLVYALGKSGDAAGAKRELDRLSSLLRPHPLIGSLRSFVGKLQQQAPDAADDAGAPTIDVGRLPSTSGAGGGGGGGGGDPRTLLAQADRAKNRAEWEKAKNLYGEVLKTSPNDSEALAGLGDVSRGQHDFANAQTYYKQALSANGSFIPALVGLADTYWDQGNVTQAKKTYKEIVDRFPEQAYPAHVKQRAEAEE
jgi:tetratricopeptide (TPR) repeat protein